MDSASIALVRGTWPAVAAIAPQAAALFYDNLFAADPALKPLFKGDMTAQGDKLMQMIGAAVGLLDQPDTLIPTLKELAVRHAGYGVQAGHYDTVGAALLKTLDQGLGSAFTPDVKAAWTAIYTTMAGVMTDAAKA